MQRTIMVESLSKSNFTVTSAENGRIAWDLINDPMFTFDLILLDLIMPEMDGLELLELIKSSDRFKSLPVIILSGNYDTDKISACINTGAFDFLVKPIKTGEVISAIMRAYSDSIL